MPVTTAPGRRRLVSRFSASMSSPLADYHLVLVTSLLLIGLGVVMVLSASSVMGEVYYDDAYFFVKRQVGFLIAAGTAMMVVSRLGPKHLRVLGAIGLFLALVLLMLTLVAGTTVNGNRNWLSIGMGIRIQPSEFAKLAMVVAGADVLQRKEAMGLLDQPKHVFFPFMGTCLLAIGLVLVQGDLGTAIVMFLIMLAMLVVLGSGWRLLFAVVAPAVLSAALLVFAAPSRVRRVNDFLNSAQAKDDDQAVRAMFALASGGWWGRGIGQSRQKWGSLPEAHTDYIFAILGEEMGLVGTLATVALLSLLCFAGLRIALRCQDSFLRYAAAGITMWIAVQATINILVVVHLFPVLGVPLPLVSYGGSSLLATLLAIGVLLACARHEPGARDLLERRRRHRKQPEVSSIVDSGR